MDDRVCVECPVADLCRVETGATDPIVGNYDLDQLISELRGTNAE